MAWLPPRLSSIKDGAVRGTLSSLKAYLTALEEQIAGAGGGLPNGGAAGESLRKVSGTDGDADWSVVPHTATSQSGAGAWGRTSGSGAPSLLTGTDFRSLGGLGYFNSQSFVTGPANTVTQTTIYTYTLPTSANSGLTSGDLLIVEAGGEVKNSTGSNRNLTLELGIGSNAWTGVLTEASQANNRPWAVRGVFRMAHNGGASAFVRWTSGAAGATNGSTGTGSGGAVDKDLLFTGYNWTVDMTTTNAITLKATLSVADANLLANGHYWNVYSVRV